jgi:hydrogenase expression/formation protein HypE
MVQSIFESGCEVHVLRDPTRGGLGTTLNEIAIQSQKGIKIMEQSLPVKGAVQGICELPGI